MVQQAQVGSRIQAFALFQQALAKQQIFDLLMAGFSQFNLAGFLVNGEVTGGFAFLADLALLKTRHQCIDGLIQLGRILSGTGNNERCTGLVDQDGIHFIDNGKVETALNLVFNTEGHVVAQVVETELVIGAVGDIGLVSSPLFFLWLARRHYSHLHAEETVKLAHPLGITAGQVIVHRHHVHAFAGKRIQVDRGGCHQGFTFTGLHFGDSALVQGHAPDELDIVVAHAHHPAAGLPHRSKDFRQQAVQRFAFIKPTPELSGLALQLGVRQCAKLFLKFIDARDNFSHPLDFSGVLTAEHLGCKLCEHRPLLLQLNGGSRHSNLIWRQDKRRGSREWNQRLARWMYFTGFSDLPLRITSKCTWGPVERPVLPINATTWLFCTTSPTSTLMVLAWA